MYASRGIDTIKRIWKNLALDLFGSPNKFIWEATDAAFHWSKVFTCSNLFSSVGGGISTEQEQWAKLSEAQSRLDYSCM